MGTYNVGNFSDVYTSRCNVCGDEEPHKATSEAFEVSAPFFLRLVAVENDGEGKRSRLRGSSTCVCCYRKRLSVTSKRPCQELFQVVAVELCAAEDDGLPHPVRCDDAEEDVRLHQFDELGHLVLRGVCAQVDSVCLCPHRRLPQELCIVLGADDIVRVVYGLRANVYEWHTLMCMYVCVLFTDGM